jgi:hypothetical protein
MIFCYIARRPDRLPRATLKKLLNNLTLFFQIVGTATYRLTPVFFSNIYIGKLKLLLIWGPTKLCMLIFALILDF